MWRMAKILGPIFCLSAWFPLTARASAQLPADSAFSQPAAGVSGTTGIWKVFTADTLAAGQVSFSASYDRVNRNPGSLTVSTASFAGSFGITGRLELGAALEANKRILVRRPDQLSFGQQALGLFGNRTPGSAPLPSELLSGSTRMPQLRFPPASEGILTGAAGYYNLLPFAGLVREGDGVGQVSLALKFNVFSESSGAPMGIAVRTHFDIPIRKGIDYLLLHPTGTADLQFGFDAIASRNIGNLAGLYWNAGYRHINQPVHVSVIRLADEVPLAFGWNAPRTSRVQFLGEATVEVFVGSHSPNTTFGAEDPVDLTLGFRIGIDPRMILSAGYRRPVNQYGGDKNGFVVLATFVSPRK
jgi:hypothetical protein